MAGHAAAAPSAAGGQWPATHAGMRRAEEGPRRGVRPLVLRGAPQGGDGRWWASGLLGLPLCGLLGLHCAALSGRLLRRVAGRLRCMEARRSNRELLFGGLVRLLLTAVRAGGDALLRR